MISKPLHIIKQVETAMHIIVGVSGASGVAMAYPLVCALKTQPDCRIHLVMTKGAIKTWELESHVPLEALFSIVDYRHDDDDLAAVIASGSYETNGMIVLPCSMKSLSAIANGYSANLLARAVDVCLKEGRKVVICPRETPLGKAHLKNMLAAADLGCCIMPPMLTFYTQPARQPEDSPSYLRQQETHLIGKILMQFGLKHPDFRPWTGKGPAHEPAAPLPVASPEKNNTRPSFTVSNGNGRHTVQCSCTSLGCDVCLCFSGGEKPHIGAVALAEPRPSMSQNGKTSASASVLCVTGHMEDMLAREGALRVASALGQRAVVMAGLHIDDASPEDIDELTRNFYLTLAAALQRLTQKGGAV